MWNRWNKFLVGHYFIFNFWEGERDGPPYRKSRFASPQGQNGPVSKENSKK